MIQVGIASELGLDPYAITAFYRKNWARPIALEDKTFFDWQFRDAPHSAGLNHCVCAVKDGVLLGVMGCTEWPYQLNGKSYRAALLTTWVVSEDARGLGVGQGILDYLCNTYEILFGSGISAAALPLYTKRDFHYLAAIPRYAKILDYAHAQPYMEIQPAYTKRFETIRLPDATSAPVSDGIAPALPLQANGYLRDEAYLEWRFRNHPYYDYTLVTHAGFWLVYRLQELSGTRAMHVVDIIGDKADITPALAHLEQIAQHERACFIDYMQLHADHQASLRANGWLSAVDDYYARVMHLFSPPEMRSPPTTSLIYWAKDEAVRKQLCHCEAQYLSKADLDLDRPTMDTLRTNAAQQAS
jgi:hypothetical protein